MLLGTRPLNIGPPATTYNGVTYVITVPLSLSWGSGEYVSNVLSITWGTSSYLTKELSVAWGTKSYVSVDLVSTWNSSMYMGTVLGSFWDINYTRDGSLYNAYCMSPVDRVKSLKRITTECECEKD